MFVVKNMHETMVDLEGTGDFFKRVMEICPATRESEEFWNIAGQTTEDGESFASLFYQYYPGQDLNNQNVLVKACVRWPQLLECSRTVVGDTAEDEAFLCEVLSKCPRALQYLPHPVQLKVPDLMKSIISTQKDTEMVQHAYWIAPEFGKDNEFIRLFVRAGGLPFKFSKTWRSRPDLVLWALENTSPKRRNDEFSYVLDFKHVKDEIRGDKEFMKKAIGICPLVFTYATRRIIDDDDIFLFFASKASLHDMKVYHSMCIIENRARSQLHLQRWKESLGFLGAFESTVEKAILEKNSTGSHSECALCVLRRDGDAHCKAFREFFGIPKDEQESQMLRQAFKNLSVWADSDYF